MTLQDARADNRPRRRRLATGIGVAVASAGVAAGTLWPAIASAYGPVSHGCRYDPDNDDDGLGIAHGSDNYNSTMWNSTVDAAARWGNRMPHDWFVVSYGSSTRDLKVNFNDQDMAFNVGARTGVSCGSDHWQADPDFQWNLNQGYYVSTGVRRTAIAVHEMGHSYGMSHNDTKGCNEYNSGLLYGDAVAQSDLCGWYNPSADDVKGATDAHNG